MVNETQGTHFDHTRSSTRRDDSLGSKLPYTVSYSLIGAGLGLGSPLGALALRFWLTGYLQPRTWLEHELADNALFYAYMSIGTVIAFALFGYFLGKRNEGQRADNNILRHRTEKLRLISVKDQLTQTFSHAYMQENLQLEMYAARRSGQPLSIVMLDFDDFKKINDTYGHLFGDHVLARVSETIRMNIRLKDILCRYGGEEFVILMPDADVETARQVAERVRMSVANQRISTAPKTRTPNAKSIQVTLSLGVATYSGRAKEEPLDFIRRADVNMYRAKREGKNRTCISSVTTAQ